MVNAKFFEFDESFLLVSVFTSPIPTQLNGLAIEYSSPYCEYAALAKYSTASFENHKN